MIKYYVLSSLFLLDLFLFFTGKPSTISYFLSSIFFLHIIAAPYFIISGLIHAKEKNQKNAVFFFIYCAFLISSMLFFSEKVIENSKLEIRNKALTIINGDMNNVVFTQNSRNVDGVIFNVNSLVLEDYYPIERRGDFMLKSKMGNIYELIITIRGTGEVHAHFMNHQKSKDSDQVDL